MNTKQLIDGLEITAETKEHMLSTIASRGKRAGFLCASRPKDTERSAAWLAIMVNICPQRASVGSILMLGPERRVYEEVDRIVRFFPNIILAAEPPYRWMIDTPHICACREALEKKGEAVVSNINAALKKLGVR